MARRLGQGEGWHPWRLGWLRKRGGQGWSLRGRQRRASGRRAQAGAQEGEHGGLSTGSEVKISKVQPFSGQREGVVWRGRQNRRKSRWLETVQDRMTAGVGAGRATEAGAEGLSVWKE